MNRRSSVLIGASILVVVALSFMLTFATHFAGLRSGSGTFVAGMLLTDGVVPYRDYFCPIPFLAIIKAACLIQVFGKYAIVMRLEGLIMRILLGLVSYFWLTRFFRAPIACWSAIFCVVLCCGDVTDPLDHPNFDMIFWAVSAGFVMSFALNTNRSLRAFSLLSLAAGVLCGMSLLTKQTVGIGISFFLPVATLFGLIRLKEFKNAKCFPLAFGLGWILVIALGVVWLLCNGALNALITENFVSGPSAKGNLFFNQIKYIVIFWPLNIVAIIAAILAQKPLQAVTISDDSWKDRSTSFMSFVAALVFPLLAVGLGFVIGNQELIGIVDFLCRCIRVTLIYFAYYTLIIFLAITAFRWRTVKSQRHVQIVLLAAVCFTCTFFISLSFPAFEPMTIPSIGFIMAVLLVMAGKVRARLLYIGICFTISTVTIGKMIRPYSFTEISEPPVRTATTPSTVPMLKGLLLPKEVVDFLDGTTKIINDNTKPGDEIFIYPEIAILYSLTNRLYPTHSFFLNIDITSDESALQESKRLLERRPAVLVYVRPDEKELSVLELGWRNGKRSGLRHIQAACEQLALEYRLEKTYHLCTRTIDVYVRPDRSPDKPN